MFRDNKNNKIIYIDTKQSDEQVKLIMALTTEGEKAGYIRYDECELHCLFVYQQFRLAKIGSKLFSMATENLYKTGCEEIKLQANSKNHLFYLKQGAYFTDQNEISDDKNSIEMRVRKR